MIADAIRMAPSDKHPIEIVQDAGVRHEAPREFLPYQRVAERMLRIPNFNSKLNG
jgi:hypothetical protein